MAPSDPQPPLRSEPDGHEQPEHGSNCLPIGTRLGEFEITRLIGEGGFGIVYAAKDHLLEREVAIKEYMPSALASRAHDAWVAVKSDRHAETFTSGLHSFVNEAKLLAQFDHPSLVKVYRFWEGNGTAYMAMPLYRGDTLRQALKRLGGPPSEAWLRQLMVPMLDALDLIHSARCYHRDVAPDNILILENGRPVLLDFGAARRVIGDMTQALTVILKPGFAPVEQYANGPEMRQGPWTDIYAFAAVVYYCITGKAPIPAVARMMRDTMVPAREAGRGAYDDAFLAAIDHALAVRIEDRTQSIAQFREELGIEPDAAENFTVIKPQLARAPQEGASTSRASGTARMAGSTAPPASAPTASAPPASAPSTSAPPASAPSPSAPSPAAPEAPLAAPPVQPQAGAAASGQASWPAPPQAASTPQVSAASPATAGPPAAPASAASAAPSAPSARATPPGAVPAAHAPQEAPVRGAGAQPHTTPRHPAAPPSNVAEAGTAGALQGDHYISSSADDALEPTRRPDPPGAATRSASAAAASARAGSPGAAPRRTPVALLAAGAAVVAGAAIAVWLATRGADTPNAVTQGDAASASTAASSAQATGAAPGPAPAPTTAPSAPPPAAPTPAASTASAPAPAAAQARSAAPSAPDSAPASPPAPAPAPLPAFTPGGVLEAVFAGRDPDWGVDIRTDSASVRIGKDQLKFRVRSASADAGHRQHALLRAVSEHAGRQQPAGGGRGSAPAPPGMVDGGGRPGRREPLRRDRHALTPRLRLRGAEARDALQRIRPHRCGTRVSERRTGRVRGHAGRLPPPGGGVRRLRCSAIRDPGDPLNAPATARAAHRDLVATRATPMRRATHKAVFSRAPGAR